MKYTFPNTILNETFEPQVIDYDFEYTLHNNNLSSVQDMHILF